MTEQEKHYDVLIIGAGASGLMAALELTRAGVSCALLEAKDRAGGRIQTQGTGLPCPIELGAEFVHGNLPRTAELAKNAGVTLLATDGAAYRKVNGAWANAETTNDYKLFYQKFAALTHDIPVAQFLEQHFAGVEEKRAAATLQAYTEGYNAADISTASTFALRQDLEGREEEQFRPQGGYTELIDYILKELEAAAVPIICRTPVVSIEWAPRKVKVNAASGLYWQGKCAIITVSMGVLQNGGLLLSPAIGTQQEAWSHLGFGHVVKIVLQFDAAFWIDATDCKSPAPGSPGFLLSSETIPTWWTQTHAGMPLLTGWLGGPQSEAMLQKADEQIRDEAILSLSKVFEINSEALQQKLVAYYITNWSKDPYTLGGYSYKTVGDTVHKQLLKQGVADTLFFAGEALYEGAAVGTVEAALDTGVEVAHKMIISVNNS